MHHPDSNSARWGGIWFSIYSAMFVFPVLLLVVFFHDEDGWFLGISAYWAASIALLAWRKLNVDTGWRWRIGLILVIVVSWAYATAFVLAVPGDTKICYDRVRAATRGSATVNLGPDPLCEGIPLQDVEVD